MTDNNNSVDWTALSDQATTKGETAYASAIMSLFACSKTDLERIGNDAAAKAQRALEKAKKQRSSPEGPFVELICHWAEKTAAQGLEEKLEGKPGRSHAQFLDDLQCFVDDRVADIEQFWREEDERKTAQAAVQKKAKRAQGRQEAEDAFPYMQDLVHVALEVEKVRQELFKTDQTLSQGWSAQYAASLNSREQRLIEREKLAEDHTQATREWMLQGEPGAFLNGLIQTGKQVGKKTLSCLLLIFLFFAFVIIMIAFSFHHP